MELKIITLIENQPDREGKLAFEHGLSLYIEFAGKRLLFDTGQTGAFLDNAEKLGVRLCGLDGVILSHGHYDHSGGLPRLLPLLSPDMPLYTGKGFFTPKYKAVPSTEQKIPGSSFQYNGNPFPREILAPYPIRLVELSSSVTWITPEILIFKNFTRSCPFEIPNPRFFLGDAAGFCPDLFEDELALGLLTRKGLVFLSGCAHPGIINMLRTAAAAISAPLFAVLGGTHLVDASDARLQDTIQAFRELGIQQIAVSHCTGAKGEAMLQEAFPGRYIRNHTGNIYEL